MDGGHINKSDSPFLFPKVPKVFPSSVFIGFINVILNISLQSSPHTKKNLYYLDILTPTIVIACGISP